jgi:hypothetical protein
LCRPRAPLDDARSSDATQRRRECVLVSVSMEELTRDLKTTPEAVVAL